VLQRHRQGVDLPECWRLAEWPRGQNAPVQFWLSNLPADTPLKTLVRLAKLRWRIEDDRCEMKTGPGLDLPRGGACRPLQPQLGRPEGATGGAESRVTRSQPVNTSPAHISGLPSYSGSVQESVRGAGGMVTRC
jgi:hypothetical protein